MKAVPFRRGHHGYASVMGALMHRPQSAAEVAAPWDCNAPHMRMILRQLRALDLVHVAGWENPRQHAGGTFTAIWAAGDGPDAPAPVSRAGKTLTRLIDEPPRIRPEIRAFAAVWRCLSEPCKTSTLIERTGISRMTAQTLIVHMRAIGILRVAEWETDGLINPIALYQISTSRDVPRPARKSRTEHNQRRRHVRQQVRLLSTCPTPFDVMARQLAGA